MVFLCHELQIRDVYEFYTLKMYKLTEVFVVSDSLCVLDPFSAFMLSTQLNYLIEENKLAQNCICVLKRHVTNILKDGRYCLFVNFLDDVLDNQRKPFPVVHNDI